jgi:hypothetical protein
MKTSINKLITKGHCNVNMPILAIYFLSYKIFDMSLIVLGISTLIAWGFWSFAIPKWKLNSVRNLNSTAEYFDWYSKAIWNGLIWPENSFINKTEFWSKRDKAEYDKIKSDWLNLNRESAE